MNNVLSEARIIEIIHEVFSDNPELCSLGIGDDCACLRQSYDLVTADAAVEGVHFDLSWMSLYDAAYRCMTANLSDIGSMGGEPGAWTLTLSLPDGRFGEADIRNMVQGFYDSIADHGCAHCGLVGGDVVGSPGPVMLSISLMGHSAPFGMARRDAAKPGDMIVVVGRPGLSAAGMALLQSGKEIRSEALQRCTDQFCRPKCYVKFGQMLVEAQCVHAMMDLSDGIGADLPKLLKRSSLGATVTLDALQPSPELCEAADFLGLSSSAPLSWMVSGGEDFGLLCTCSPLTFDNLKRVAYLERVPLAVIGECHAENSLEWLLGDKPWKPDFLSFSHFSNE